MAKAKSDSPIYRAATVVLISICSICYLVYLEFLYNTAYKFIIGAALILGTIFIVNTSTSRDIDVRQNYEGSLSMLHSLTSNDT